MVKAILTAADFELSCSLLHRYRIIPYQQTQNYPPGFVPGRSFFGLSVGNTVGNGFSEKETGGGISS
jgi:hypothetical protein